MRYYHSTYLDTDEFQFNLRITQNKGHPAFGHHIAELRGFMDHKRLEMRVLPQKIWEKLSN